MIWRRLKNVTNIRKIKNSVKPLMMPSQKLNLQEQDISPPKEKIKLAMETFSEISRHSIIG